MCGIFAYITNDSDINNPKNMYNETFIKKQFKKGQSRGPESSEMIIKNYHDTVLFLGFHRLAINGLDELSNQPMCIDGIYLICNGEIYNYKALSKDIKLKTNSDCEVIIHMYKMYGIEYLFELLDGVFAFILYDTNIEKVYIARDPYGVRPLYFHNNCGMTFASEIKQINCIGVNIKQFEPGSFMELSLEKKSYPTILRQQRFSSFGFSKMIFNNLYDIYGILYQGLYNAVKKRVVGTTDRPVACLLSGGLDSSTIAALTNSFLPKGTLETYSIGLEGSPDLMYAQKVADHLGTIHTSIVLTEDEFFNAIPEVIKAIESYDTTSVRASVGNYLVGKYISEHSNAKVIMNGDGADELMGGYRYFNHVPNFTEFDRECKRLLTDIQYFDVLRSDKSTSSHGLEPRTPFLDFKLIEYYLNIPSDIRNHNLQKKQEKYFIRQVINKYDPDLLPKDVLFRKKEAFSDGVSGLHKSWFQIIQDRVKDEVIKDIHYEHNTPITLEQKYYRQIYESYYTGFSHLTPYFWMPKYVNATDASARTLHLYMVTTAL